MSSASATTRNISVNFCSFVIIMAVALTHKSDPFWTQSSLNPIFLILAITGSMFGFIITMPLLAFLLGTFFYWAHFYEAVPMAKILTTYQSWCFGFGFATLICIFSEFNISIIRHQKNLLSIERQWMEVQKIAAQQLEKNIQSLKWRLTVETQPMSHVIKYARGLIGATPPFVAKFTLDLITKRFGLEDLAFYVVVDSRLERLDARGSCQSSWPEELNTENINAYPYAQFSLSHLKIASPKDNPNNQLRHQITCPILTDTGHLRGLLVCENLAFMELTTEITDYLAEVTDVCGSALTDGHVQAEANSGVERLRPFRFYPEKEFRMLEKEINKAPWSAQFLSSRGLLLNGIALFHGRQKIIFQKLIATQLERRHDITGFFTLEDEQLAMIIYNKDFDLQSIIDDISLILTQLEIFEMIQIRQV